MEDLLASARLPRLILIGDGFTVEKRRNAILKASEHVPWVHLRDHNASDKAFKKHAADLADQMRDVSPDIIISVNSRVAVAKDLDAGFHGGAEGASISDARKKLGPEPVIGFSAHYLTEAQAAVADGADYVFFSPIFASPSKPGFVGVGINELREFCERIGDEVPVYALGGVTPERVASCLDAGAHGVAVLSGILLEDDVEAAAESYMDALQKVA